MVGDALPKERRALRFTVQSILRRIPIAIAAYGVTGGMQVGLVITIDVFVVLYALNVIGISAAAYGILIGVHTFPVAVVLSHDFVTLLVAFVVGGLREIGEPARKALIVDLVRPSRRPRSSAAFSGRSRPLFRSGRRVPLGVRAWACSP